MSLAWLQSDRGLYALLALNAALLMWLIIIEHFPLKHRTDGDLATWVRAVTDACR